jgi:2-polyprenyl-3-methyl-5-hydroxy-6-metoxy-1,4-benzoquinol methylase
MTAATDCRLCGSPRTKLRIQLDGYGVYRCQECDAVFSDLTAEQAAKLYDAEYFTEEFGPYFAALFGDADDTPIRKHFTRYLDTLERAVPGGRLLDVGCAAGLFLDVARARGWEVEGVEISDHAASVAREKRGLEVIVGDVMDISLPEQHFDAVSMLDVLEHIIEPGTLLDRVRGLIKPGGALMLVLPNDRNLTTMTAMTAYRASMGTVAYPASRVHQIYHVTYFTPATITALLQRHGFEVIEVAPDETVRGLINESPLMKAGVNTLFAVSRVLGLQNKMIVLARPA